MSDQVVVVAIKQRLETLLSILEDRQKTCDIAARLSRGVDMKMFTGKAIAYGDAMMEIKNILRELENGK